MRFHSHSFPEAVLSGPGQDPGSAAGSVDGLVSVGAASRHHPFGWKLGGGLI